MRMVATLLVGWSTVALGATYSGTVTDLLGSPIPDALIVLHWDSSGSRVGLTSNVGISTDRIIHADRGGHFSVELPLGFYDVFVTASAFTPTCRKIRLRTQSLRDAPFLLRVDSLVTNELGDRVEPR